MTTYKRRKGRKTGKRVIRSARKNSAGGGHSWALPALDTLHTDRARLWGPCRHPARPTHPYPPTPTPKKDRAESANGQVGVSALREGNRVVGAVATPGEISDWVRFNSSIHIPICDSFGVDDERFRLCCAVLCCLFS